MRWVVLALVAVTAVAFWELRLLGSIPLPGQIGRPNGDLFTIYYPLYAFAYRLPDVLPAWNPYQLAGTPARGQYAGGLLYPPNILAAIVPVERALGWLVPLHLALAGGGTVVVARAAGLSFAAAALAASGYMLNAFLVGEHLRPMYLNGLAWIPWVAWLAGRLVMAPSAPTAAGLGIVVALQFLTGHAQVVCYEAWTLALVAAPVAVLVTRRWQPRELGRVAGLAALATAVATLLAAAQLVPLLEVFRAAGRGPSGLTLAQTLPQQPTADFVTSATLSSGLLVLLTPFAVLLPGRHRALTLVCLAVALFAGAIAVGCPLYARFFFLLPGVALFRLPHQILLVAALATCVLAAAGLDALRLRPPWHRVALAVIVAGGLAAALWSELPGPRWVAGLLLGAVLLRAAGSRMAGGAIAWGIVALVIAARFATPGNRTVVPAALEPAFFAEPPFVGTLRQLSSHDRTLTIKDWRNRFPIMEKAGSLWRFPVVQDYEAMTPAIYRDFFRPLESTNIDAPEFTGRFVAPQTDAGWRPLDLLSTRFIVVAPNAPWFRARGRVFREVYRDADATIFENPEALPRAYLATTVRVEPDRDRALATLQAADFDLRTEVILEEPLAVPDAGASQAADVPAEVSIRTLSPTRVEIAASTPQPAVLVLTDLHWPGWRVTVDGARRPLLRANHLVRGVALEPGLYTVVFTYVPRAARTGVAITVVTVLGLLAWLWRARRRECAPT